MQPNTVMIFAAGFGARMGELTRNRPKPLLPVTGRTLIDRTLDLAQEAGVARTVVNTHYLADQVADHLTGTRCIILHETPDILDTGGGLKAAAPQLGNAPVFTANPDVVWLGPNPFTALASAVRPEDEATLLLVPLERAIGPEVGDFHLSAGRPRRRGKYVYSGVQIIRPEAVTAEPDRIFSLNRVWDRLIENDNLGAVIYPGTWCDVGSPEGLERAEVLLSRSTK